MRRVALAACSVVVAPCSPVRRWRLPAHERASSWTSHEGGGHRRSRTRTRPPRASTWSRPWAAAWRCSTTTTMGGWTCSSRTARSSRTRCRAGRLPDKSDRRFWNRLYRQTADGTFTDVTEKAGVTGMPQNRYGMGVAVGDYDNDGFADLYVTNYGGNTLYRNSGDGTFADVTAQRWRRRRRMERERRVLRLRQRRPARSVRHALRRVELPEEPPLRRQEAGLPRLLPPRQLRGRRQRPVSQQRRRHVHRRVRQGGYRRRRAARGSASRSPTTTTTGSSDVYVANDSVQSFLFRNKADGTFARGRPARRASGSTRTERPLPAWASTSRDYDNDGRPDIIVTDLSNERYRLFRHNGDGSFRDVTNTAGVGGATLAFSGWSTRFFDYDNDGWKDIFVAQGHVMDTIEKTVAQPAIPAAAAAAAQRAGRFVRVMRRRGLRAGLGRPRRRVRRPRQRRRRRRGRQQRRARRAIVLRNDGGNRRELAAHTAGRHSARTATGSAARVKVVARVRAPRSTSPSRRRPATCRRATSGCSSGSATITSALLVEIRWPTGVVQTFDATSTRAQTLMATEPASRRRREPATR